MTEDNKNTEKQCDIHVVVSCSTCLYADSLQSEEELKCWHCKNYNKHEPK